MSTPTRRQWLHRTAGLGLGAALPTARAQTPPAREAQAPPPPAVGSPLALPEVPMLDGSVFRPAAADGQVLVLYWWASWCPFCAQQSPLMDRLWREQAPRGLHLLGLSIDKTPEAAAAYLRQRGHGFPSGWVTPAVARVLPKPKGLPVTLVRGRDGRVLMAEAGQLFPEDVAEIARFIG
jgi:thiol-disulfide isomerase/thioredoxin